MKPEDIEVLRDLLELLREQGVTSAKLPAAAGPFAGLEVVISPRVVQPGARVPPADQERKDPPSRVVPAGLGPVVG